MDPCVTCGTTEETTSVCTCDCQCLETARRSGCREIKLIAPTRDTATAWTENDPIVPEGVFFLVKDRLFDGSVEYGIGDGESKYSELSMLYAGAPLSRTGAENRSPLAASGKSTLDPSWLPEATSNDLGAVMTSTTGAAGKVPIAASGSSALDPSWLPAATSSTLGAVMASTTTAANNVVKADANGGLDGWKGAIIDAITADDGSGGLTTDPVTGELMVDFSQMPTDKFEALLKGLKMQIPLEANLNLYVNKDHSSAGDSIVDGRGTQTMPFKTIQACINFATQTYAVGQYTINIFVAAATTPYAERLELPTYTRTSGNIVLRALDDANPPTITNPTTLKAARMIGISGGSWTLRRLHLEYTVSDPDNGVPNFTSAVFCNGGEVSCNLSGCSVSVEYDGSAPNSTHTIEMIVATGGALLMFGIIEGYQNTLHCVKGNATNALMLRADNGTIRLGSANYADDGTIYDIPCSGSVTVFAQSIRNGLITTIGGGLYGLQFSGTVTGKKYDVVSGSGISAPSNGFPGDTSGTVESATYCWYKE